MIKRIIKRAYRHQLGSSRRRGHPKPEYSETELLEWVKDQPRYTEILNNYLNSFNKYSGGYDLKLTPSIDRIKDDSNCDNKPYYVTDEKWAKIGNKVHYTLDNIELMTLSENIEKLNNNSAKTVSMYSAKTGEYLETFLSYNSAARAVGVDMALVRKVCLDYGKTACKGLYIFLHFEEQEEYQKSIEPRKFKEPKLVGIAHRKPVVQVGKSDNKFIKLHSSAKGAAEFLNSGKKGVASNITQVCRGNLPHRYKYGWWYKQEYIDYLIENNLPIPKQLKDLND